jgi:hypothetical protein
VVLWTTTEWEAWPRGLSKAAARVMTDPLVLYTVMAPVWILAFNVSWPHRVSQQSPRTRALYVLKKLLVLPFLYAILIWILNPSATFLWVRRSALLLGVWWCHWGIVHLSAPTGSIIASSLYCLPRDKNNTTPHALRHDATVLDLKLPAVTWYVCS